MHLSPLSITNTRIPETQSTRRDLNDLAVRLRFTLTSCKLALRAEGNQALKMQEIDQKAAIMIVIEHVVNIPPGTKCSAVFMDTEKIRREKDFHARLYSQNGVHDAETLRSMVAANVPNQPYWLVSLKPGDGALEHLHRVDAQTGQILAEPGQKSG